MDKGLTVPEPVSAGGGTFIASKIAAAVGGFIGGLSVAAFWQPQKLKQHGKLAAGAIIGGISVGGAFTLGGVIARLTGLDFSDIDTALGIGFLVGVLSVFILSAVAKYFDRREGQDILEVADEIKTAVRGGAKPAGKAPARKKRR